MPEWKNTSINEFLKERNGRYKPNDPKVVNLKRLDKIDFSGGMHFSNKPSKTDMIIVQKGDLIISGINVAKGAIAVYDGEEETTATIHYSSYQFDDKKIDVEYFKRFLRSPKFVQLLKDQVKGGIKTEIKAKHLLPLKIDLPDLETQKSIVEFFKNTENKISQLGSEIDHQQTLLKQLRQSVLQEAVEGKLTAAWRKQHPEQLTGENHAARLLEKIKAEKERLIKEDKIKKQKPLPPISDAEKPFELPEGWVWCRLGDIITIKGGKRIPKGYSWQKEPTDHIYIRVSDMENFGISDKDLRYISDEIYKEIKNYIIEAGDLYLTIVGSTIGKLGIVPSEFDNMNLTENAARIIPHIVYNRYLMLSMLSYFIQQQLFGKIKGMAQPKLALHRIQSTLLPLPTLKKQQTIVEKVDRLLAKIDALEAHVKTLQEQAEQLMQAVLREAFEC